MDNLDVLKSDNGEVSVENKTFLEFEISDQTSDLDTPETFVSSSTDSKELSVDADIFLIQETVKQEEFSMPDAFDVAARADAESAIDTPSVIRPTYLPRFTEVSDTYRMQNDPRPRPNADSQSVKVEDEDESQMVELDATTEKLEEREVEKIVVTSGAVRNPEPTDETLTVLKFSTPIDSETQDASEIMRTEPTSVLKFPEDEEVIEENVEETPVEEVPEEPKNTTIPDPDATFRVIDFTAGEKSDFVDPLGASDSDKRDRNAFHTEFVSPIQRDTVKDRFLDTLMSIKVRLTGSLLLLLAMIAMDCLHYFGIDVMAKIGLGGVSSARAIIDMQFSICIFLFTLPEIIGAFKLLVKGKLVPELINVFSLAVIVMNDLTVATSGVDKYLTFGVLYGLQCFATVFASYKRTESNFISFKLVSRNVAKNILDRRLTRELPRENIALDGVVDEYNSKTARMFSTVFVSGFFKRSSAVYENFVNVAMMIGIGTGIALVTGLVSFFIDGYSLVSGVQSFAMVFMFAYPIFSILAHKLPLKHVADRAALEESAFVGETSVYEGADIDVFTYEDTEIFGVEDVSIRKVHLYGKAYNTPKAMKQMYALFSVVGGPLDFVFSSALDRKCAPAKDVVIEDNGVSGTMDGHKICAGTEEYMINHGITIPEDDYRTNTSTSDSTKIMYGAEDGEVYVKFFIRYSFSEEFTMLLPELKDKKIVPLVYTRDPNITAELLKVLTPGEDIIRVMKKYIPRFDEEKTYRRVESGIVTHGNKDNAINMVLLAKKYSAFQSSLASNELISMIVGATLAILLALGNMFVLPATLLSLWQVVWCIVLYFRSRITFFPRDDGEVTAEAQ